MSILYELECFFKKKREDGVYLKSLNLGSLLVIMLLIIVLCLEIMLLEQIIAKRYVNQGRRRTEMAVIIRKGHHFSFFKLYNLTIIVPVYF